jgi:hypothetical protein
MSIPSNISPLGVHYTLPAGYTRLAFLESTGTQYIDTQQNAFKLSWELKFQVPPPGALDAYACNGVFFDKQTVQVGCINDPDGRPFLNARAFGALMAYYADKSIREKPIYAGLDIKEASAFLNGEKIALGNQRPNLHANFLLFARWNKATESVFYSGPEKIFYFNFSGETGKGKLLPSLDTAGVPCMYDLVTRKPFKNAGTGQFVAGVKDSAQLRTVLRKLPATGGSLTLSLPAEANTPEVAEALQACHDTKGWTLTVHEYRPAAASTYSLRRVREVVWCRREQSDLGSYVDPTGTRWQIDRCAAIFGPHGQDPTAYGYEPFDSVDAATAYWEITPYVETEEPS